MKVYDIPISTKGFKLNFGRPVNLSLSTKSLFTPLLLVHAHAHCSHGNTSGKHFLCHKVSPSVEIFLPTADKKRRPHMSYHPKKKKKMVRENTVIKEESKKAF